MSDAPERPASFQTTTPDADPPSRPRPWIVRAYLVWSVLGATYGMAWIAIHGGHWLYALVWTSMWTTIVMLVVWNASRVGWVLIAAWGVLSLPYTAQSLQDGGFWGWSSLVIHGVSLGIVFSPWMLRWIWRGQR